MHRPRRFTATSSLSVASTVTTSHSSSQPTRPRPPLGGNAGLGGGNGGIVPPTTIPSPIIGTPTTIARPNVTNTPTLAPPNLGGIGSGNPANGGFESTGTSTTTSAPSGTLFFPPSTTRVNSSGANQADGAKAVGSTSVDATGPTASRGDSSQPSSVLAAPDPTTSTIVPTSSSSHRDMSSGIIAGVIAILICFFLVLAFIHHRKRKAARIAGETSDSGVDRENVTTSPIHLRHEETGLVFADPHSPSHTHYAPTLSTPRSPRWLADSNSDVSQLSLPPPPMVEIEARARAVPLLILDTSRYRRSPHASPVDNRLPLGVAPSGDSPSRRLSRGRHPSPHDAGSPVSPKTLSPFEAFCSSKPQLSFHSSGSSSRPSSQTSLRVPPSPTRVPPSPTNFRSPPSPRTPPRSPMFIPPIPPLPKSPPPVPESYIHPFVGANPFDDPSE